MLGIDELNVLNQDAGALVGAAASNYADMFEEMAVSALAFEIKDIFFKWKDLTLNDIIDKIVVGLGMVTGAAIGWSIGGPGGAAIGAIIGAGVGLAITRILPDFSNLTKRDIQNLMASGISGAIGFAVGFGIGGFGGGLLGMAIGVGLSIVVAAYRDDIAKWWGESVAPWFTKDRWQTLGENAKQGLITKWSEFRELWANTATALWWREDVAPWFTNDRWQGLGENMKQGLATKWNEFTEWWNTTGIVKWWNSVTPWFSKETWIELGEGLVEGFKQTWKNAVNAAINILNKLIDWVNEKLSFEFGGIDLPGLKIDPFSFQLFTLPRIPAFEYGGLPVAGPGYSSPAKLGQKWSARWVAHGGGK